MKTRVLRGLIGVALAAFAVVGMAACKRSHRAPRVHVVEPHPAQADTAAYAWLALVDSGKADQLGAVQKRTMTAAQPMATQPNGPKGDFVGMQFRTDFANKTGAVETIAVVHDTDGKWHVARYSIR